MPHPEVNDSDIDARLHENAQITGEEAPRDAEKHDGCIVRVSHHVAKFGEVWVVLFLFIKIEISC
eukprot:GAFH01004981.1.p2 GENE.GAFH01004981.1~~GAFH01004981.1.p2  ORF type:complete len:76 (+),score=1.93 GAFH01004981.1:34-228(+)